MPKVHGHDHHRMADANIPYHCHTEHPQVSHVLGDVTVILITRQEVHTHHQVADVHTRITRITSRTLAIRDIPTVTPRGSASDLYRKPKKRYFTCLPRRRCVVTES